MTKATRERSLAVFVDFRLIVKVFSTNALSNASTFKTDKAKLGKFSPHLDKIQ